LRDREFKVTPLEIVTAYILPFLVLISAITFVHEMGHFVVGRICGVRVDTFSLGLGPELFARVDRMGRRWRVGVLPFGGYVKFHDPEPFAGSQTPANEGSFSGQKVWRRAAIVVAGPLANFLLAIAIFTGYVLYYGIGTRPPIILQIGPGSAAEAAGLQPGDRVVSINGNPISDWRGIENAIVTSRAEPLNIRIVRQSNELTVVAIPRISQTDSYFGKVAIPFLGVGPSPDARDVRVVHYGLIGSAWEGAKKVGTVVAETGAYFSGLVSGQESVDQISGPLRMAKGSGEAARLGGLETLTYLAALLSISIGIVNLLPIPILDGGRLVYFSLEAMRGRPISARSQEIGFRFGAAFIVAVMVLTTYNDLRHLSGG
jgi:regulator of sigma E protease